jgi:multiple sugar transport system permease protein
MNALARRAARFALLALIVAAFVAPVVVMVLAGAMSDRQVFTSALWPRPWVWSNFTSALDRQPLVHQLANTMRVVLLSTLGVLLSSIPAAYALARLRWRGREIALVLVVAAFLLPPQVTTIPLYYAFAKLHLVGTLGPLIIPSYFGDAFSIFLLRQFFLTVPDAMLDACRLEGAGEWTVLRRVVLPMTRPAITAVALLNALFAWNDFYGPYVYVGAHPENWTVAVGLAQFRSTHTVDWNVTMAAASMVALPLVLVFVFAQRRLTDAIAAQAAPR